MLAKNMMIIIPNNKYIQINKVLKIKFSNNYLFFFLKTKLFLLNLNLFN